MNVAGALLLILVGVWLTMHSIVGDLAGRLLSWRDATTGQAPDGGGGSGGGGGGGGSW